MTNLTNLPHGDRAHSPWGASSANRWMNCPGSVGLIEKAPEPTESKYASEGTCAHELAEETLLGSGKASDYIGNVYQGHTVDEEMAEHVQTYVDYITKASKGGNKDLVIEERFNLDFIAEGLFGSNDACILEFMGVLEVIDLKYGKGLEVEAKNNKQLLYYALGAAHGSDFEHVKLTIIQPRIENSIKSWTLSVKELNKFGEKLKVAVDETKKENPKLLAGDHCIFCPAKAICPAQREAAQKLLRMNFSNEIATTPKSLPAPEDLDDRTLMNILDHTSLIKKWLESVSGYSLSKLKSGGRVKGYKLVKGRSVRKVTSETEIKLALGDGVFENKLLGVTALEKKFGKAETCDFFYKPEPKLTLAREEDKRPAVGVKSVVDLFGQEPIKTKKENFDNFKF